MSKVMNWVVKRHWWFIVLMALLISTWEVIEYYFPHLRSLFVSKILFYLVLLLFGWLLDFSSRKINTQYEAMKILKYKHHLSQEFVIRTEWDALIDYIVRLPGMIAATEQTYLFVANPYYERFECVAQWNEAGKEATDLDAVSIWKKYLDEYMGNSSKFGPCGNMSDDSSASPQYQIFCLPIQYGEDPLGSLLFRLKHTKALTNEQTEIFENIGDEIAIALKIGQERQIFEEMLSTKAALDQRRTVSHYLHDHLGQNLGYVNLKLGQLISDMDQLSPEEILSDLKNMREAASASYDFMRGVLETNILETTPLLTNLLTEHARKVAKRANFEVTFKAVGKPAPVDKDIQRAIYYAFQELLSNVERHASASKVEIHTEWANDHFEFSIHDNGIGFDPQAINTNQHFGLEIMRERLEKVKGHATLTIYENVGALVNVSVPI